jgi:excisionase family DNA binding protein
LKQILITLQEASEYTKLAKSTIYTYIHNKKIPFVKIGKNKVLFDQNDLSKWIESKKKKEVKN